MYGFAKLNTCTLGGEKLIHKKRRLTLGRLTTTSPPPHVRGRREQRRTTPLPNVLHSNSTFSHYFYLSLKEKDHFPHVNQLVFIEVAPVVCHLAIGVGEKLNLEMSRPGREAHDKDGGAGDF